MIRAALALLLLPLAGRAEWLAFELVFQGTGCASCIESLPKRIQRMRGVESAEVDVAASTLRVRLAADNRVRIELVRDQIEQDGTKVTSGRVEAMGSVVQEAGGFVLRLAGGGQYPVGGEGIQPSQGDRRIVAELQAVRPVILLRLAR